MSTDRGMDKEDVVHLHSGILAINRNEIMAFVTTWMDLEIIMLSEVNETQMSYASVICGILKKKKKGYDDLLCRADTVSQILKNLWFPKETGWG